MDKKTANILEEMIKKLTSLESMVDHWKFYDIARVAENKSRSTNDILVYLSTKTPELEGKGDVEVKQESEKFLDDDGNEVTVNIEHISAVTASWMPMSDRSLNAPDVRKNERVFIYRYADSETLYWIPTNLDVNLRRLETRTFLFSGDPDGKSNEDRSPENSYAIHVSTHDKVISVTTTNLNGEPFTYAIELDTDKGTFTIVDNEGNVIRLDSKERQILLENSDKTKIILDKKNIDIYAPEYINVVADKDIDVKCENFTLTAKQDYTVKAKKGLFDIPETTFTGKVSVAKGLDAGTMESKGKMTVKGPSTFSAPMTATGITSSAPIKGPNDSI